MMAWLEPLQFLRPWWLLALLAMPLFLPWWHARRRRRSVWRDAVDPHLLPHLLDATRGRHGRGGPWLGLLAYALVVCALAGPSWRMVPQPLLQGDAPLVVALELSSATLANDLPPSRLLQARSKIDRLLRARSGGQTGLLVYADDAYTVAPLTDDAGNIALFLDALSPDVMPVDGSRPDRAIEAAVRLLQQAGFARGDILLLASTAAPAARDAASRAQANGYRVSVIGMGTIAGAAYRRGDGSIARSTLDPASLATVASAGGGQYSDWTTGTDDLAAVGALAATSSATSDAGTGSTLVPQDGGYWLLPLVMVLGLFAFRRGGALAMVLVCLCLPALPVHAQAAPPQGDAWRRPDQAAHARSVVAEDAFRRDDFEAAARAWDAVPGVEADYNRGNALARAGRYEDAIEAYDEALRRRPAMADATANRAAVAAAMARQPPPGPGDGSRGKQQPSPGQGKPQPGAGEPGERGEGDEGDPQDGQPPADDSQQQSPEPTDGSGQDPAADLQRQREADAAQRERMQRALEGKQPAADGERTDAAPERAESAAEREQQQANEAWLRRVPDDPGGLLRAKFRLEHERRQRSGADSTP